MAISKFTLYLGLNDKDTKTQKVSTIEAYKIVSNMIAARFDGGTIFEALGIYRHSDESAAIVTETTLRIELLFADRANVLEFCKQLKVVFNQESIAIQYESIESELI
jgi:hypothetical protein